jgi:hypothetical protein
MRTVQIRGFTFAIAVAVVLLRAGGLAQSKPAQVPDITGSWERVFAPPSSDPSLKPQYLKEWQSRVKATRDASAKGEPLATNNVHCIPEGMPAMMSAQFPMEILQSRGQVTIIEEAFTQVRRILLDRPVKAIDDVEPGFFGHSVGRWEGDTLVVETIGIKESVRFRDVPHSKEMRIRERIHLVSPTELRNDMTIEDPVTLEKPWPVTFSYRRMAEYTLLEYVCEDNREYADEQGRQKIRVDQPPR